jgi:hypothetical protein
MRQLGARLIAWIREHKVVSGIYMVMVMLVIPVAGLAMEYWDFRAADPNPNSQPSSSTTLAPQSSSPTGTVSATTPASSTPTASLTPPGGIATTQGYVKIALCVVSVADSDQLRGPKAVAGVRASRM